MTSSTTIFSDPYFLYKEFHKQKPIFQDENGTWHLTRYDDVRFMLSDLRFARKPPHNFGFVDQGSMPSLLDDVIGRWSLFNDPPEHTRLRNMMSLVLTPRFIKDTRNLIENVTDNLLNALLQKDTTEFMMAFAYPLPVAVISKLLGISLEIKALRQWSLDFINAMDKGTPEDFAAATPSIRALHEYFYNLIQLREKHPVDDWVSQLIALKNDYGLNVDDLVSTCIFFLMAGHETVQLSLGIGLMTLLKNPDQYQLLQQQPELIPSAVEEILRFESPLNKVSRWTREKIEFDQVTIPENQLVVGLLNAANRDPLKFERPDTFDVTRANNRHLAFGVGIHNCLGSLLARLELQTAFSKLVPHMQRISLIAEEIHWMPYSSLRYLFKLPISIRP